MSGITKGVVAAVLLAGAVAGAAAFPRFLAGPGDNQTPAIAVPQGVATPAIVRARPLPVPHAAIKVPSSPIVRVHTDTAVAARAHVLGRSNPVVVPHVAAPKPTTSPPAQPSTPITPAPSPSAAPAATPAPTVVATPTVAIGKGVVVTHHSSTPFVPATSSTATTAPSAPVVAQTVHVAPTQVQHKTGGGNGKQNQPRVVAVVASTYAASTASQPSSPAAAASTATPALGSGYGQSTSQVTPSPLGGGGGHVGRVEAPHSGPAPSGHDRCPATRPYGRDQSR
jgi:hypothetical protein